MKHQLDMAATAEAIGRSLSHWTATGKTAFVATAVSYPNGTQCVVRIDHGRDGFSVSDDAYGHECAELMGLEPTFSKLAGGVAKRAGVAIDRKAFVLTSLGAEHLPAAVVAVANASSQAVLRTSDAAREIKIKRSRETFNRQVRRAFGAQAAIDVTVLGATREWDFEAAVSSEFGFSSVISLVSPSHNAVASANMKLGDIRQMIKGPVAIAALSDYDGTEAAFRMILAGTADAVIAASADPSIYLKAAAPMSVGVH